MSVWTAVAAFLAIFFILFAGPVVVAGVTFAIEDLCFRLWGRKRLVPETAPRNNAASIVIPTWNGRDLLKKFLPSVIAALAGHPDSEVLVVDNASTDGSAEFLREAFPEVRVLALEENRGFGGGSNLGFQAAKNDIVVLLNNDMRVEPGFLAPLLEPFSDPLLFSVSCQIFFGDSSRRREETGLTETWWERGQLRVSHRADEALQVPYPCAYPGGGSSAFDRRKFLELGGFDELLRPFYYEDTDLGHRAWKRGWKLLYQPNSIVVHEHRGTIGKRFSPEFIEGVLRRNVILYCWKNIHDWRMLLPNLLQTLIHRRGLWRACLRLGETVKARWQAHSLTAVPDGEAFRRQKGGYYRDRFQTLVMRVPDRLRVLFAAPYPIEPPVHGGAVFMKQTLEGLAPVADIHFVGFIDTETQREAQGPLNQICASTHFLLRHRKPPRNPSTMIPHAVREFWDRDFEWAIHRTMYLHRIDVVQLDYTILGQYRGDFRHIPCFLFEHDIFFQSLWRGMETAGKKPVGLLEYARMLRYELGMVKGFTRVQVCSRENADYLVGFEPELKDRIDADQRAAIDTARYPFVADAREPDTILFVGSFRHAPNLEAINWFTTEVLPLVVERRPAVTLVIVGAEAPVSMRHLNDHPNIRMAGFVEDVREPLTQCKVFLCPVLAGSGVRVKLLEAFASGIPVVSTAIGAEGLATKQTGICEIADTAEEFAAAVVRLLSDDSYARELARRAREMVERDKDSRALTVRLAATYRREAERLRKGALRSALQ
ncbi:MAG TPA: glycosyltransferase [Bryobacteraceae bacterium]|nr:glycosyltransferase [Bryobacteraceae bacterium]